MDLALQKINELCKFMDFSHAYDFLHDNTIDLNIKRLFVIISKCKISTKTRRAGTLVGGSPAQGRKASSDKL